MPVLLLIILIPLIGACFTSWSKYDAHYATKNIYNTAIWTILAEIGLIIYTFSKLDVEKNGIQLVEKYNWIYWHTTDILLGADILSMLLLLSINFSFLIAGICLNRKTERPKTLLTAELIFIGLLNGYILAADIISFYMFFASLSIPLLILISAYGGIHKKNALIRFSIYSVIGALLLLVSIAMIYNLKENNIPLNTAGNLNLTGMSVYLVWFGIFLAFVSRMPIWPFHYWISAINSTQRNPVVFLVTSLISLVGLYGFMRFWPNTVPETIAFYAPIFEIVCVITMLVIALICLSHKDFRYKLFAYTTVYCLLYLIGVFLPTGGLKMNIGYSVFTYIIIMTVLSFLISHIETQKKELNLYNNDGVLCYMPRVSVCLSLFVLAGIGLPITPLFWNNFIIISEIFNYNLVLGVLVMVSLCIVAVAFLEELYKMKGKIGAEKNCIVSNDLPKTEFIIYIASLLALFFSFIKPLWFIF